MRGLRWWFGILLLGALAAPASGHAQSAFHLPRRDRVRLAEAVRLADEVGERIWPGWRHTPMPVLLVTDSAEFLVGHPHPTPEFTRLGSDDLLRREIRSRPRRFSPDLLATFPAVAGLSTIVVGSAERTGKSSTAWVLTVLHEHFHQWQYSLPGYSTGVARLDLARGDTTGQWMLEYPFPYDSVPVQRSLRRLARALAVAVDASPGARVAALEEAVAARDELRADLGVSDYRYLEFQLWQEGVARFIEYSAARAAARAGRPLAEFERLADSEPYGAMAGEIRHRLRRELEQLDLAQQRRVAFYPVGAAIALLLEYTRPDWKRTYTERPFVLAALLSAGP